MGKVLTSLKYKMKRFLKKNRPTILCYHSIHNNELAFPIWTQLARDHFEEHLQFLVSNFKCVSLSSLLCQLKMGRFDPHSVAITFDDGYRNNFTNAFPLLKKYKIPATIFITTQFTNTDQFTWSDRVAAMLSISDANSLEFGGTLLTLTTPQEKALAYRQIVSSMKNHTPDNIESILNSLMGQFKVSADSFREPSLQSCFAHLTWEDIKTMLLSGLIEIGSHGVSHTILSRLDATQARKEISQSKMTIDEKLAEFGPVKFFAYPNGGPSDYTQETHKICSESGYNVVLTMSPKRIYKLPNHFVLPRFGIGNQCCINSLRHILSC